MSGSLTIRVATMENEKLEVEEIFRFIMLNHHQLYTEYMGREARYLKLSHKDWQPFLKHCMQQWPNYL